MRFSISALATAACVATYSASFAQDGSEHGFGVTAGVGSMGLVIEPSYRLNESFGLRAPIGFGSYSTNLTFEGINYDSKLTIGGVGLIADFYPFESGFRVGGGIWAGNEKVDSRSTITTPTQIGNTVYNNAQLNTLIDPKNDVRPLATIGYSGHLSRFSVDMDIGVIGNSAFNVNITETTGTVAQADIDAETAQIRQGAADLEFLPFLKFGARLSF
ncbi:hypothetical protein FHS89_000273 [Rubricella aquisinus]|uniref:Outer membrane protein beta-barrel domain-containing protein n=1 Tax=Rubricella aquisinus TaxID=2028108 RepID=A0A840WX65_9RHOB|nr:hypothetical protein [Rubricella aquisinus]MBB5514275.1 hypothetical protein [Rubricella aquisinus]